MHSERLGKALAGQRRGLGEPGRGADEHETNPSNIIYFSIKPMGEKQRNVPYKEPERQIRERKTTNAVMDHREDLFMSKKYSPREERPFMDRQPMMTEGNRVELEAETGRSFRGLNQFFKGFDDPMSTMAQSRGNLTPTPNDKSASKVQLQRFAFPQQCTDTSKKNSSMISSKSYEVLDSFKKDTSCAASALRPDELMKNRTLANFNKILEQSRGVRTPGGTFFNEDSKKYLANGGSREAISNIPASPNDSYIFKQAPERSNTQQIGNSSPSHSVVKNRQYDKSKISALNRSDISKTSNGNASFLTRRGDEGDLSRVAAQGADSNNRGGMSKTWVKSGLLDSREEISTISKSGLPRKSKRD